MKQSDPLANEKVSSSSVNDERSLYARVKELRWKESFEGAYAECFCALLASLDPNRTLREVVEILPHFEEEFSLLDFMNAMANLGLHAQKQKLRADAIVEAPALVVPSPLFGAPLAPLVILSIEEQDGKRIAKVFDGKTHRVRNIDLDKRAEEFRNGAIYLFKRRKNERAENEAILRAGAGYGWFRRLAIRFYKLFAQILVLSFFINLLGLATPLFIMMVYDRVIAAQLTDVLPYLVGGVTAAIIADWVLRTMRSHRLAWIAARIDNIVGNLTFSKLTRLPARTTDNASVTAQLLRLRSFESLRDFFSSAAFLSVMELPFVAIYLLVIAVLGGVIIFVPLACIVAYISLFMLMRKRIGVEIKRTARKGAASQRFLLETFTKASEIRTLGLVKKWTEKYASLSNKEFEAFAKLVYAGNFAETLAHAITLLGGVATLSLGATMIFSRDLSAGALIACLILTWRTLTPFHNFCAVVQRFEQIRNSIIQIDALMEIAAEEEERTGGAALRSLRGGVIFERVGLRLDDRRSPVFMDISFKAAPGEIIGFCGDSGSGKSLILKLVQGVYEPSYGAVRLDGFDIRQLNTHHLRRLISFIPQRPQLFSASIEENIRLVRPEASIDEIWRALDKAGASEQVKALPHGVRTNIGADQRLSVDLLMQISLARAYLLDGRLFLIDELPNPLIASPTGRHLKAFIRESAQKRTVLLASQHPDILGLCDRVYEVTSHGLRDARANRMDGTPQSKMERVA